MASVLVRMTWEQPRGYLACRYYEGLVDTPGEVLEVEDLLVDEPRMVGVSLPVKDHLELVEAARFEMEVRREVAAARTESLRVWRQGLLEG